MLEFQEDTITPKCAIYESGSIDNFVEWGSSLRIIMMTKNSSIPVTAWIEYNFFFILFSILVYHPIKVVVIYSLNSKVRLVAR